MKEIIVERWESFQEFRGKLFKVDLESLAKEIEDPSILKMNEDELNEFLDEIDWNEECYGTGYYDGIENIVSVVNQSDPDLETNYFMNKKDAMNGISWRGFWRGDPEDWENMNWETKKKRLEDLEKKLTDGI